MIPLLTNKLIQHVASDANNSRGGINKPTWCCHFNKRFRSISHLHVANNVKIISVRCGVPGGMWDVGCPGWCGMPGVVWDVGCLGWCEMWGACGGVALSHTVAIVTLKYWFYKKVDPPPAALLWLGRFWNGHVVVILTMDTEVFVLNMANATSTWHPSGAFSHAILCNNLHLTQLP